MNSLKSLFSIGGLLLLFSLLISCNKSKNVYYFYEDGSGKTESVVDIGDMLAKTKYIFTSTQSKTTIEEEMEEEVFNSNDLYEYNNFEEEEEEDIVEDVAIEELEDADSDNFKIFDMMFAGFKDKSKFDTTVVMKDLVPETILQKLDRPGLLENIILSVNVDEENEIFILKFEQRFAYISQIRETQTQLEKVSKYMGKNDTKPTQLANPNITFDTKERSLYVPADSVSNFDLFDNGIIDELITEEQIDKMIEMTGIDKVTTTYHFPFPITSVETESHYILSEDKKSVEVRTDIKALIKNGHAGSLRVRY